MLATVSWERRWEWEYGDTGVWRYGEGEEMKCGVVMEVYR